MKCNRRGLFPRAPAGDAHMFDVNSLNRTPTFASPSQGLDAGEASAMPCASVARPLRQGANVGLDTTVQNLAGIIPVAWAIFPESAREARSARDFAAVEMAQRLAFATQLAKSLPASAIRHTLGSPDFPGSLTSRESGGAPAESEHAGNRHDEADQQHRADENRQILVSAAIDVEQEIEILGL